MFNKNFITEALKRSYPDMMEHNVNNCVKDWLKLATARLKNSKKQCDIPNNA